MEPTKERRDEAEKEKSEDEEEEKADEPRARQVNSVSECRRGGVISTFLGK